MVCKDEVCTWFKHLSPHKRIDFLCGMLHMCLPMELRFIGSYVEDLAKKDFHHLREAESKVNDRQVLSQFSESDGKQFRSKMAVYLALLHSSNRTCSNLIFQLVESKVKEAFTVIDNMDDMTIHSILLVLAMAVNHPAFTHHQKTKMSEYYKQAINAADRAFTKPEPELYIPAFLSEPTCDLRTCDQHVPPLCSSDQHVPPLCSSSHVPLHIIQHQGKVHVCDIEMKGSRHHESEKTEQQYRLQVTWSNGEKKDVYKSYQDLVDFHNKLLHHFPDVSRSHALMLKSPVRMNHKRGHTDELTTFTRALMKLPEYVVQCNFFTVFFESTTTRNPAPVQMSDASTSPRPQCMTDAVSKTPEIPAPASDLSVSSAINAADDDTSGPYRAISPQSVYFPQATVNGDVDSLSPQPPHIDPRFLYSAQSPSCSTNTISPRLISPCNSPASSLDSLPNSQPGSPGLQDGVDTVTALLNGLDLGTYSDKLTGYTLPQLSCMPLEEFEHCGMPRDAAQKLKMHLDVKFRDRVTGIPNGYLDSKPMLYSHPAPGYHHPYLGPQPVPILYQPHLPPPNHYNIELPYTEITPPLRQLAGVMATRDASPTNSELSSPSVSPQLQTEGVDGKSLLHSDSSSDDADRDQRPGHHKMNGMYKTHSAPGSARTSRQETKAVDDPQLQSSQKSMPTGSPPLVPGLSGSPLLVPGLSGSPPLVPGLSGSPPLVTGLTDLGVASGGSGASHSGYISDPTYNAPRPPLVGSQYKPRPAHISNSIPPNYLIHMPDSNYRQFPHIPGMNAVPPPHFRDAMAAAAMSNHGYNQSMIDPGIGHRSMQYIHKDHMQILNRSQFNALNGGQGGQVIFNSGINNGGVLNSMLNKNPASVNGLDGNGGCGTQGVTCSVSAGVASVPAGTDIPVSGTTGIIPSQQTTSVPVNLETPTASSSPTVSSGVLTTTAAVNAGTPSPMVTATVPRSACRCECSAHNALPNSTYASLPSHVLHWQQQQLQHNIWQQAYSNGLLQLPMAAPFYRPPLSPYNNGINQELLFAQQQQHHQQQQQQQQQQQHFGLVNSSSSSQVALQPSLLVPSSYCVSAASGTGAAGAYPRKARKTNCHNCGSSKHLGPDCAEVSMDAITGPMLYSYKPKTDSD